MFYPKWSVLNQSCFGPSRKYDLDVEMPLYQYCNTHKPSGVLCLCNWFGLAVWIIDGSDECIAAWHNGEHYSGAHRQVIHYSDSGRPYIRKGGSRYYFDQIMCV